MTGGWICAAPGYPAATAAAPEGTLMGEPKLYVSAMQQMERTGGGGVFQEQVEPGMRRRISSSGGGVRFQRANGLPLVLRLIGCAAVAMVPI